MQIIDAHCHYGPGDGLTGPWDTRANLDRYETRASEADINKTVIFAAFHSDYPRANELVGRKVLANSEKYFGFVFINADKDAGSVYQMVEQGIRRYGFKGIKVHRYNAPISREICQVAQAFRIPILYDVMGKVATVELLAREYPEVNFIIPHLGSFADNWEDQLNFIPILERHSNIYTDTSGIRRFDLLEMAVQRAGVHKILFGSDGPWLHPGVEMEKIFALKLPAGDERLVLGGNILRLMGMNNL